MRLRWTVPAAEDLENIKSYLDRHYPQFSEPTVRTIYQRARSLKSAPNTAGPVIVAARANYRCRRYRTSSCMQSIRKQSRFCTSTMVLKIGDRAFREDQSMLG